MRPRPADGIALALAAAAHLAAALSVGQTLYARHPMVDAYTYWEQASQLFAGTDPFAEGLYQPPGYPAFLAVLGLLTGRPELAVVRWTQAGLGILTAAGLWAAGRRLGERHGVPWAGAAAALLFSLYPTTLLFEQDILTPALTGACLVGALLCLLGGRLWAAPLGGLLVGLAVVCHPTYLLAGAGLGLWRARQPGGRRAGLAFLLALALALVPTTARNLRDFGEPALVSHNAGINFYLGNNPAWRRTAFLRPGLPFRELALEAEPHRRNVAERDDYWRQRTLEEIADHPDAWAATLATKLYWSVHSTEIPRNEDYRCRVEDPALGWLGWLPVRYGWVLPLALLGAVRARRDPEGRLLAGLWALLHLPLLVFLVADRYRLATWPLLCLLAPLGVPLLRTLWQHRSPWGLALLAAAVIPWLPIDPVTQRDPAWCRHVEGNLAYMEEDYDRARVLYEEAVALDPEDMGARGYLAAILQRERRYDAAAELFLPVVRAYPDHFPSLRTMSELEQQRGNVSAAADYMGQAYRVPGDRTSTGKRYVKLLLEAGRRAEAEAVVAADPALQRALSAGDR